MDGRFERACVSRQTSVSCWQASFLLPAAQLRLDLLSLSAGLRWSMSLAPSPPISLIEEGGVLGYGHWGHSRRRVGGPRAVASDIAQRGRRRAVLRGARAATGRVLTYRHRQVPNPKPDTGSLARAGSRGARLVKGRVAPSRSESQQGPVSAGGGARSN